MIFSFKTREILFTVCIGLLFLCIIIACIRSKKKSKEENTMTFYGFCIFFIIVFTFALGNIVNYFT